MRQLRLSRPSGRRPKVERLTGRQHELLLYLRSVGAPVSVDYDRIVRAMRYAAPRRACERLVARGLVVKVSAGVYRARTLRERSV